MRAIVLGSAAGGGYPQWNCRCEVCGLAWRGDPRVRRRTQSSLAVSADDRAWVLFNCSPDVREQIAATPALWPRESGRHSPIAAVVVSNADVDHVGGLLSLRERTPFDLWATEEVHGALAANPMMRVLAADVVRRREFRPGAAFEAVPGLPVTPFRSPGKVALYLEGDAPVVDGLSDANTGFVVGHDAAALLYAPGCARVDEDIRRRAASAGAILFDGTLYSDDELLRAGVGEKTGRRMGHIPIGGAVGSLRAFPGPFRGRRIYIHLNNTNPVLVEGSPQRRAVEEQGWEVGYDGMEVSL